jgi:hypothetical protein
VALAIDASTPAVVVNTSATTATITTASFTPPAGSVLLILWTCDEASGPAAPSITDNLGAHLTYTQPDWKRKADAAPNLFGQAASWTTTVGTSAAMTVTVTSGSASGERVASLSVQVLTGADTTTPVGAHGKSGSSSAASISQSYTAAATGGRGFIAICDADVKGAQTAGTGTSIIGSGNILTNISYALARRTASDDSSGVSNSINTTLAGTSTDLAWVYVEILPAAGGGPTPISLGDAGAAAEAVAVAASTPLADAGAAAQTLAVTVAAPLSDTASSAEAITAAAAVPLGDTGSAGQTLTAAVTTSLADTGTAVDSLVAGIAISLADAGSASEALTVTVAAALADSASAGQTLGVTATAALADSGHAADTPAVTAAVALADAAAAAESLAAGLVEPDESGGTRPRLETSSRPRTITTSSRPSRIDTSSGGPQ